MVCFGNGSFEYLAVFNAGDYRGPETPGPDDPQDVVAAWENIQEWRYALDRFDRICDLPEALTFNAEIPFFNFRALRDTAGIYEQYFLAGMSAGQQQAAAEAFCRLSRVSRVARNGLDNASLMIHKMIFASIVENTIETTWTALQNENMDRQTLITLHENFPPVGFGEISLARPLISEYLIMKSTMRGLMPGHIMDSALLPLSGNARDSKATNSLLSRVVCFLGFKPNRSLADMKIYYDRLIEASRRHPVDLSWADAYMQAYLKAPPSETWSTGSRTALPYQTFHLPSTGWPRSR